MNTPSHWICVAVFFLASVPTALAQDADPHADHVMMTPADYEWSDGPASLPPGARVMVIEGSPAAEGEFTLRLWFPADYQIPPHFHPGDEHVTVISGTLYMGLGEILDESAAKRLPPGGFAMMKAGTRHFAFTGEEEAVIQLHGIGPWGLTYLDPADDPRNEM